MSSVGRLFSLGFGVSFLNVTESDKRVEDGNGRVHDDWVIPAVLSRPNAMILPKALCSYSLSRLSHSSRIVIEPAPAISTCP
jgi:hypothetical protein